jgi:hypothetical protein
VRAAHQGSRSWRRGCVAARGARAAGGKLPTIGSLGSTTPTIHGHWAAAFVQRLGELGWIEARSEIDKVMSFLERVWRRLIEMGRNVQKGHREEK